MWPAGSLCPTLSGPLWPRTSSTPPSGLSSSSNLRASWLGLRPIALLLLVQAARAILGDWGCCCCAPGPGRPPQQAGRSVPPQLHRSWCCQADAGIGLLECGIGYKSARRLLAGKGWYTQLPTLGGCPRAKGDSPPIHH